MLSVVIATWNRRECLRGCLERFRAQTDPRFEVVVAIDGSTDGTVEMLAERAPVLEFLLRWDDTGERRRYGLAKARNLGIRLAAGEAVAILDDDAWPEPEFVEEHLRTVRPRTLTGGWRGSDDPRDALFEKMRHTLAVHGACEPGPFREFVVENNTCMLRDDWLACGAFDERLTRYGQIGQDLYRRLVRLGYEYQFNPRAAVVVHREFDRRYPGKRAHRDPEPPGGWRDALLDLYWESVRPRWMRVCRCLRGRRPPLEPGPPRSDAPR